MNKTWDTLGKTNRNAEPGFASKKLARVIPLEYGTFSTGSALGALGMSFYVGSRIVSPQYQQG
jgi:hypothetical protein